MESYLLYGVGLRADLRFHTPLWRQAAACDLLFERLADRVFEPSDVPPSYRSPRQRADGGSVAELYRLDRGELLRFPGDCDFLLEAGRIGYRLEAGALATTLELHFLGAVLSYWLERRGVLALHASVVEVDGRAVGFLASEGRGKTTLAATFLAAGHRLLSDDLLALEAGGGGWVAHPGYPALRMWPEQVEWFFGDARRFERVHPRVEKRLVRLDQGPAAFQPTGRRLAALYRPSWRPGAREVTIAAPTGGAALIELVRCSFSPHLMEGVGLQAGRLERLGRLAETVPVRTLAYPGGRESLESVRQAVLSDLS